MKPSFTQAGLLVQAIVLLAAMAACSSDKGGGGAVGSGAQPTIQLADGGPTVETVNGEAVPERLLNAYARSRNLDLDKPDTRDRALKELANYVVAAQAARDEKFLNDPDFAALAEVSRLQAVSAATVAEFQKQAQVDDAALRAEYDKQIARNPQPIYDFSQIVFRNQADATKAAAEIAAGKTFEKVADAHKKDALQTNKLVRMPTTQLSQPLAKALAAMKPGETSKAPVQTPLGWTVVRLDATSARPQPTFEDMKEGLRRTVVKRAGEARMVKARADARITRAEGQPPLSQPAAPTPIPVKPAAEDAAKPKN
jgi:peptidyl-prolyl cis-trans isomerase C